MITIDTEVLSLRSTKIVLVVGALVICGLAFANYQQYGAMADARRWLIDEEKEVEEAEAQLKSRLDLAEREEAMEKALQSMERMVPPRPGESEIISDIQSWADDAGIGFISIRFADRIDDEQYVQMPLELSFEGHYTDMLDLTRYLIEADRAFRIEELRMGSAQGSPPVLSISVRCSVFFATDE